MKRFQYNEGLKIKRGKTIQTKFKPKSKNELKLEISKRLNHLYNYENKKIDEVVDLTDIDVSGLNDLSNMFDGLSCIVKLDISNWDVSNIKKFDSMFYNCKNLISLDLSKWQINQDATFVCMFSNCLKLTDIGNISNWKNTILKNKPENLFHIMFHMFKSCNLLKLNLEDWNLQEIYKNCDKKNNSGLNLYNPDGINEDAPGVKI